MVAENVIFGHHDVAAFEFVSPRPWQPETGNWTDFKKSDQNVIFGPDEAADFEFVSPRSWLPVRILTAWAARHRRLGRFSGNSTET